MKQKKTDKYHIMKNVKIVEVDNKDVDVTIKKLDDFIDGVIELGLKNIFYGSSGYFYTSDGMKYGFRCALPLIETIEVTEYVMSMGYNVEEFKEMKEEIRNNINNYKIMFGFDRFKNDIRDMRNLPEEMISAIENYFGLKNKNDIRIVAQKLQHGLGYWEPKLHNFTYIISLLEGDLGRVQEIRKHMKYMTADEFIEYLNVMPYKLDEFKLLLELKENSKEEMSLKMMIACSLYFTNMDDFDKAAEIGGIKDEKWREVIQGDFKTLNDVDKAKEWGYENSKEFYRATNMGYKHKSDYEHGINAGYRDGKLYYEMRDSSANPLMHYDDYVKYGELLRKKGKLQNFNPRKMEESLERIKSDKEVFDSLINVLEKLPSRSFMRDVVERVSPILEKGGGVRNDLGLSVYFMLIYLKNDFAHIGYLDLEDDYFIKDGQKTKYVRTNESEIEIRNIAATVLVDAWNVFRHKNSDDDLELGLRNLKLIKNELLKFNEEPLFIFQKFVREMYEEKGGLFEKQFNEFKEGVQYEETRSAKSDDDRVLLNLGIENNLKILSNDYFRDWRDKHPNKLEKLDDLRVTFDITNDRVTFHGSISSL